MVSPGLSRFSMISVPCGNPFLYDKFIVQLSDGNILFECPFEPKKNRWCLNYPLIKPDAYDATDRSTSLLSCAVSPSMSIAIKIY
ncbi:uncharacterized protein VP01_100g6 [Puccinia sorghi]|uniref:Uncharacterized protein n=1 Tax=Puccinia sorghi TaxID=27349 RepID=A0A0L6VVH4_9BASI|nr:uncharacterized protein VP01_100g6 [Puccinia sorghi]